MLHALILIAQEGADKAKEGPPLFSSFLPFVLIAVVFYFLIVVPGKKERQQRAELINKLKKNDEVITSAGIIGVVQNIKEKEDEVTLRLEDNARMRVLKSSIVRIKAAPEPVKEQPK